MLRLPTLHCCHCGATSAPHFLHLGRVYCLDHIPLPELPLLERSEVLRLRSRATRSRLRALVAETKLHAARAD